MWSPDADEDADEADREDAQAAAEAAPPDAAAEQAALDCAAEEAAAAAAADEEAFLLPCERVRTLSLFCSAADNDMQSELCKIVHVALFVLDCKIAQMGNFLELDVQEIHACSRTEIGVCTSFGKGPPSHGF